MNDSFEPLLSHEVVLDTAGTIIYLGRLTEVRATSFVLDDADVHDCREGHAGKEVYILESAMNGVSVNRRRVFVMRSAVLSISKLSDVVTE